MQGTPNKTHISDPPEAARRAATEDSRLGKLNYLSVLSLVLAVSSLTALGIALALGVPLVLGPAGQVMGYLWWFLGVAALPCGIAGAIASAKRKQPLALGISLLGCVVGAALTFFLVILAGLSGMH